MKLVHSSKNENIKIGKDNWYEEIMKKKWSQMCDGVRVYMGGDKLIVLLY